MLACRRGKVGSANEDHSCDTVLSFKARLHGTACLNDAVHAHRAKLAHFQETKHESALFLWCKAQALSAVCAKLGLECIVYMGCEDMRRQSLNVLRIRGLGGKVIPVTKGSCALKDTINEAMRDLVSNLDTTYHLVSSAIGCHLFPTTARDFRRVIGNETKEQLKALAGRLPDTLVACVGGGSNAIGIFHPFSMNKSVRLVGAEAAGNGVDTSRHSATMSAGAPGVFHGAKTYLLQDKKGQVMETHSIAAGLNYPGVGPEHSWLKSTGRAEYHAVTDAQALEGFRSLAELESIVPSLEESHAVYQAMLRRESNQQLQPESHSSNSEDDSKLWKGALGVCTLSEVDNILCEALDGSLSCQPDNSLAKAGHEPGSQEMDTQPCTPENRSSQPSAFQGSPRTRITGRTIRLGLCEWANFIDEDATFVDKSAAIADIMSPRVGKVIAGMYPRRMGKTTFLQTLANFLDIVGDMPRSQREKHFRQCALYELHPKFFEENFAKYPVIMLDFKTSCPKSFDDVPSCLRKSVLAATSKYTELLCNLLDDVDSGYKHLGLDKDIIKRKQRQIKEFIDDVSYVMGSRDAQTTHLSAISGIIPDLMKVLYTIFGRRSVLIVDEYDAPFMSALCHVEDAKEQANIQQTYSEFLCESLKNNKHLHSGILVGVFDVRGIGLGSGLNNVDSYMAHSGFVETQPTENPFQHAFGFTIHDVWGLINDYVDNQWPYRVTTTGLELGRFKRDLLVGCIQHFDGYRIGQVHHVFNPHAILCLIRGLRSIKSLADVDYSRYSFWTETGSMKVVEAIKASSAHDLSRYCEYLSSSFLRQSEYRQHQGPLAEHMSLDFIDDAAVGSIGSQEQPQFPPDVDKETREELADICMVRSGDTFHDMQSLGREPLQASTIMRLLYQAGYIVPIAKDRVGIPNSEVHRALEQFYERVAAQLKISTSLLESIHEEMGIYKCDLQRFSRSLHSCMVSIPGLGEDTSERFYQTILSSYLFPATRSGYAIHNEAMMENGRADTLLFPAPGHLRFGTTPMSYYIFELKRYDGKTTPTSSKRTTVANRRKVAKYVFELAMQAQAQIYERYYPTLAEKARTCDLVHVVGVSFWMNRFCMIATKRKREESADGAISWPAVRYEGSVEIEATVEYEQLGDRLEDAENGILREVVVGGHLVVLTI
ncbi:hypothetical protein IW138_005882 [Coemansia sp. RSA 986]|nr:hypothetical protein IW138_005882 [Coemansia sp. RSA 986]